MSHSSSCLKNGSHLKTFDSEMASLQDSVFILTLATYLAMSFRCGSVMYCICHHFIKLPPVLWHRRMTAAPKPPNKQAWAALLRLWKQIQIIG